jgi:hypothetical protein
MVKAVVSHGEIRPIEPLPDDWRDGQTVRVEKIDEAEMSAEEIDRDFHAIASLCATSDPADEKKLDRALDQARREAKELVRRQMGLA